MPDPQSNKANNQSATRSPSGADLVLLLLLIVAGFGIWALVERGVSYALRSREPNEQRIMDAHNVTEQKALLTEKQNEIADLEKYLDAARVDKMKQKTNVDSFVAMYPQLRNPSNSDAPPELTKAYTEAIRQSWSAHTLVASLESRLLELKDETKTLTSSLGNNKEAADAEFARAKGEYELIKRLGTFVITLAIVVGLLGLIRLGLFGLAKRRKMSTAEGFRPFVFGLVALVILFAYDQFGYAGAALVGIVVLLFVLRKIKWPRKGDVLANEYEPHQ